MLPALVAAGASLGSSLLNRSSQEEYNNQQAQLARENMAQQREFAQNGIRWKVNDAIAAGVHPLAALGASTTSFSPVQVGGSAPQLDLPGQDISRAVESMMQKDEKASRRADELAKLSVEKAGLENDILKQELASKAVRLSRVSGQVGPGMPSPVFAGPLPKGWQRMVSGGPDRTISEGTAVKDDDIKQKAEDYPATKIVRPFGYPLAANPWLADGQQFEDRYGESEIGSTLKFGVNTIGDHLYTAYKWGWEPYWKKKGGK